MFKKFTDFTAFDLETTGLDNSKDRIIEIGAVRVRNGNIEARFSSLCLADRPLTILVENLTGITNAELADAPPLADALQAFLEFVGSDVLLAHNVDFDFPFLLESLKREGIEHSRLSSLDSLLLARMAWPNLPNHRLDTLVQHFGFGDFASHRAGPDAEKACLLFLKAQEEMPKYSEQTLANIGHVVRDHKAPWSLLFPEPKLTPKLVWGLEDSTQSVKGPLAGSIGLEEPKPGEPKWFDPEGPLSKLIPDFEPRLHQREVAQWTDRAIQENAFLILEAPSGTGKSFASLLVSARWAGEQGKRVVVTVSNRKRMTTIQNSTFPILESVPGRNIRTATLKARDRYICLRKTNEVLTEAHLRLTEEERLAFLPVLTWLERSATGDIESTNGFNSDRQRLLWRKLCADHRSGLIPIPGLVKPACFYQIARAEALKAHVILVPQIFFLEDSKLGFAQIPSFDALIIDEAHRLPNATRQKLGRSVRFFDLRHTLQALQYSKESPQGLFAVANANVQDDVERTLLTSLLEGQIEPEKHLHRLFAKIGRQAKKASKDLGTRIRYVDKLATTFNASSEECLQSIKAYCDKIEIFSSLLERESLTTPVRKNLAGELRIVTSRLMELHRDLAFLSDGEVENTVFWMEDIHNPHSAVLQCAPLWPGRVLQEKVWPLAQCAILHSGALSYQEQFHFARVDLGLDEEFEGRLLTRFVRFNRPLKVTVARLDRMPFEELPPEADEFIGNEEATIPAERVKTESEASVPAAEVNTEVTNESPAEAVAEAVAQTTTENVEEKKEETVEEEDEDIDLPLPTDDKPRMREFKERRPNERKENWVPVARALMKLQTSATVIFPSIGALRQAYTDINRVLKGSNRRVYAQHLDGNRENVLHLCAQNPGSICLGTESLLEGVVPVSQLAVVVFTKLFFPPPGDPIIASHTDLLKAAGLNAFQEFLLPETVLRFKAALDQALEGSKPNVPPAIWLLDSRIVTERYGRSFSALWNNRQREVYSVEEWVPDAVVKSESEVSSDIAPEVETEVKTEPVAEPQTVSDPQ